MTTIAYRDGIMAADSRAFSGDKHPIGMKVKIHRLKDGSLFGASSSCPGLAEKLRRLVEEKGVEVALGEKIDATAVLVRPDRSIFYFAGQDNFSGPLSSRFIAIGSGEAYAHGALMMGADAATAVDIACECDVWSAPPITVLALDGDFDAAGH